MQKVFSLCDVCLGLGASSTLSLVDAGFMNSPFALALQLHSVKLTQNKVRLDCFVFNQTKSVAFPSSPLI